MTKEDLRQIAELLDTKLDAKLEPINKRLDAMDGRLDAMDGRLDAMDGRLDAMDGRLDAMDGRLDAMDGRLDAIEENTEVTRGAVNALIEWADNVSVITEIKFPVEKKKA